MKNVREVLRHCRFTARMQSPSADDERCAKIETQAEAARGVLRMAASLVAAGRVVDLAGLQDSVGRVCAGCLDLSPEQGRAMRPMLIGLAQEVERLDTLMRPATP